MQAMNGSLSLGSRGRLIGLCIGLALAFSALTLAPAANAAPKAAAAPTYLAVGDSLAFGFTEEKFYVNFPTESPSFFTTGYPTYFAKTLRMHGAKGLVLVNDGCPGETSEGFIGENPAVGGQTSTEGEEEKLGTKEYQGPGDFHPCRYHYHNQLPLHNGGYYNPETGKPASQLEQAAAEIKGGKPVHKIEAITLDIGANDELAGVAKCEFEVGTEYAEKGESKYGETPEEAVAGCLVAHHEEIFNNIAKNTETILNVLLGSGYKSLEEKGESGPIVLLGAYNPNAFVLPGSDGLQQLYNQKLKETVEKYEPLVKFANPYTKINGTFENSKTEEKNIGCTKYLVEVRKTCKKAQLGKYTEEGNVYDEERNKSVAEGKGEAYNGEGDIHPTPEGAKALAKVLYANF